MLNHIRKFLAELNYEQYEISNFAKSFSVRSKHNTIYWDDSSYLGIGLSSHSYFSDMGHFGTRFSNPRSLADYLRWVEQWEPVKSIVDGRFPQLIEELKPHESLTDFCHISLRRVEGLSAKRLEAKYGSAVVSQVANRLKSPIMRKLVDQTPHGWTLTDQGKDLSNQVFLDLTFLASDYPCVT
jgi:oxygen-independent coproporphyrinogen-3 oxidase